MSQLDRNRMDENIVVQATFNLTDGIGVAVRVKNTGAVDARLVSIWLITDDNHVPQEISPPITVPAGTEVKELDSHVVALRDGVDINPREKSSFSYHFKVVTERGNIATTALVSEYLAKTNYPVILHPEVSNANQTSIELHVWNSLNEETNVNVVVVTPIYENGTMGNSTAKHLDQPLPAGKVSPIEIDGVNLTNAWKVQIELVDEKGFIIGKYYLPVS